MCKGKGKGKTFVRSSIRTDPNQEIADWAFSDHEGTVFIRPQKKENFENAAKAIEIVKEILKAL